MPLSCPRCGTGNTDDSRYCRSCATPLPGSPAATDSPETRLEPADDLSPGSTFAGRYQIIEDLGHGGMGRVVKALDTRTGEKVAIKIIRADIGTHPAIVERFAHELTAARKIAHRNVCRMYDLGEDRGRLFITMEYVAGEDLKSVLRMMGALNPAQAVGIARQICDGLEEAHRLGVIHRDLKPANILVDRDGTARIMDFGIARSPTSKGITGAGTAIGTPEYMSPEQAEGRDVDGRSDIYSLGVMLFELTTGRLPMEGSTPVAIALKHKTEPPPDPRTLQPAMPAALSRVILKCLEKAPARRYGSATELSTDLEGVAAGLPTGSAALPGRRPATLHEIAARLPLKRLSVAVAALVVLVAAGVFFLPGLLRSRGGAATPRTPGSVAVVAFENQTGDARYDYLRKVIPNLLITNLENTGLFQVATWERMRDLLAQMGRGQTEILDADAGFDYCRREGVAFVVVGSFTRAGDTFVTECKLLDAESRRMVRSAVARGAGEASILDAQIEDLSRRVAEGLGVASERIRSAPLAVVNVTTRSLDAYNAYLQGIDAQTKFDDAAARAAFETAVRLDPDFAVAYLHLGESMLRSGERNRTAEAFEKAMALASHASEKERLLIGARYATSVERNVPKARELLAELVAKYPREKDFRVRLGSGLMASDPDAAITQFESALALDPGYGLAMNQLAFTLLRKGDYAGAQKWLERYAAAAPTEFNPLDSLGQVLLTRGFLDEARTNYEKARALNPRVGEELPIAYILALQEDYDGAISWLDRLTASSDAQRAEGPAWKGILFFLLGRRQAALGEFDKALALVRGVGDSVREVAILVARGLLRLEAGDTRRGREDLRAGREIGDRVPLARDPSYLAAVLGDVYAGDLVAARAGLAELEKRLPPASRSPVVAAMLRGTQVRLLLAAGDDAGAIRLADLPQAHKVLDPNWNLNLHALIVQNTPWSRDQLAQALARRGDLDGALNEYRVLMTISPETNTRSLVNPMYHLRLAGVYEKKGDTARAAEHYRTFLRLWKDADPGLPEPAEARTRLAALGG